jgi:hypothetical protein
VSLLLVLRAACAQGGDNVSTRRCGVWFLDNFFYSNSDETVPTSKNERSLRRTFVTAHRACENVNKKFSLEIEHVA